MGWISKRRRSGDLESELRARREAPREEFVDSVVYRLESASRRIRRSPRLVLAAAVAGAVVVSASVFGGLGYAGSAAHSLASIKSVSKVQNVFVATKAQQTAAAVANAKAGQSKNPNPKQCDHGKSKKSNPDCKQYKSNKPGKSQEDGRSGGGHSKRGGSDQHGD
jgi:hypothetical protein